MTDDEVRAKAATTVDCPVGHSGPYVTVYSVRCAGCGHESEVWTRRDRWGDVKRFDYPVSVPVACIRDAERIGGRHVCGSQWLYDTTPRAVLAAKEGGA